MEPNDILKRYLDVCSNKSDKCTRYTFASNGILEWFGRNIKDNSKIFEYIRYNLSHQYEHIFTVAVRCEAFEEKPLHKATRQQPPDVSKSILNSKSFDVFETPPGCSTSTEADGMVTPERKIYSYTCNKRAELIDRSSPKSCRITRSSRKRSSSATHLDSPSKRSGKIDSDFVNSGSEQLDMGVAVTEHEPLQINEEVDVSELKYIEAIGTIRKLRKLKHRGIDATSKNARIYESPTRQHWDAENTKLKISYRESVSHNSIQFVLVIYQHLENNTRCRRDLMAEFTKTCTEESTKSQKVEKKSKINKSLKMKRLRF